MTLWKEYFMKLFYPREGAPDPESGALRSGLILLLNFKSIDQPLQIRCHRG